MDQNTVNEGKTTAIIAYITFIGTIIAFVMNNSKKNSFAQFHIRQMIGLILFGIVNQLVITKFIPIAGTVVSVGLFILWIIGLIGAVQGEKKKIPLLGDQFQDWFKGI